MFRYLMFCLCLYPALSFSCSVAQISEKNSTLIAHNLDWPYVEGVGVIHPRGVEHHAELDDKALSPLSWVSLYGNVIFHGRDETHPIQGSADGMNEKGLFASVLILNKSRYPAPKDTASLDTTHWVQYVLDNFKDVSDTISGVSTLQMVANNYKGHPMRLHLYVADKSGNVAVFEYLDGKLVIHQKKDMTYPLLTNDPYLLSLDNLKNYTGFGGKKSLPGGYHSDARFVRMASFLKRLPEHIEDNQKIAIVFSLLSDSAEPPYTLMPTITSNVYDLGKGKVYFRTIYNQSIRVIDLSKINFNRLSVPIEFEIHSPPELES